MADALVISLNHLRRNPDQALLRSGSPVENALPQAEPTPTTVPKPVVKPTPSSSTGKKKASTTATKLADPTTYVVKAGDTLLSIADEHGLSITELMRLNQLKTLELREGQLLRLKAPNP
jgi:LysM repeat protein